MALHAALEERGHVAVVGVCGEGQPAAVLHELLELGRLVQTQLVHRHFFLLALNVIVFFVFGASWETLPRKRTAQEVKKHVADGLEIIAAGLLVADVSVDGGIPRRAGKILALTERDVLSFGVLVALGEAEVDDVDVIFRSFAAANQEVVWLDVAMDDSLLVHLLDAADLFKKHTSQSNTHDHHHAAQLVSQAK